MITLDLWAHHPLQPGRGPLGLVVTIPSMQQKAQTAGYSSLLGDCSEACADAFGSSLLANVGPPLSSGPAIR